HPHRRRPHAAQLLRAGQAAGDAMTWLTDLFAEYGADIAKSMAETGYMMLASLLAAVLIGLPLGMVVYLTERGGIAENRPVNMMANLYINVVRSFPFLLLVVFF